MILQLILLCLLTIANLPGINQSTENSKGRLIINFDGLRSNEGTVKVALTNSKENYKDHKNPFIGLTIPISNRKAVAIIEDIPFGEYAVKAFHDEDANDMLNTNFLGIPNEDYGFSNNARGMFGPPSWNAAKFKFNKEELAINITIK